MTVSFDCHDSRPYMSTYSCYLIWVPVWYAGFYTTLLVLKYTLLSEKMLPAGYFDPPKKAESQLYLVRVTTNCCQRHLRCQEPRFSKVGKHVNKYSNRFLWVFQVDLLILSSSFVLKQRRENMRFRVVQYPMYVTFSEFPTTLGHMISWYHAPSLERKKPTPAWRVFEDVQPMNESMSCRPEGVVGGELLSKLEP